MGKFDPPLKWHGGKHYLPNNAAGGDTKHRMTESVWRNFIPQVASNGPPPDRPVQPG